MTGTEMFIKEEANAQRSQTSQRTVQKTNRRVRRRENLFYGKIWQMQRRAEETRIVFDRLTSLSPEEKGRIRRSVRFSANIMAVIGWRTTFSIGPFAPVTYLLLFAPIIGSPFIVNLWIHQERTFFQWVGIYLGYAALLGLSLFLSVKPLDPFAIPPERRQYNQKITFLLSYGWFLLSISGLVAAILLFSPALKQIIPPTVLPLVLHSLYAVVFAVCCFFLYILFVYLWFAYLLLVYIFPFEQRYVEARIIFRMLMLISYLEEKENWLAHPFYKQRVLDQMEQIASMLERGLPRQVSSKDSATDLWIKNRARRMGASIREKKKWVLAPKADTQAQLLKSLAQDYVHAASGDWDAFSQSDPEPITAQNIIFLVRHWAGVLVRGALPMLILFIVQSRFVQLSEQMASNLWLATTLWLILTVLLELDPDFKEKLDVLGKVKSMV
ncbi:MAG: hypothetical protein EHM21_07105 [Chloroflexi bacterium]|nr:MAG: hypothetical protein EHM21_07105 [Chloroflexota bacterium]